MRGISEDSLIKEMKLMFHLNKTERGMCIQGLIDQCQELQEPWMTLDEFLNKPRYEWHWIMLKDKQIHMSYVSYNDSENYVFYCNDFDRDESYSITQITHVMPIHKPEPPR